MIAVCQNTAISVDANIDKTLEWATASQKPWFLKSEELYLVAKKAIEDLKLNDFTAVQQSISVIDKSTATLLRSSDSVLKTSFSSEEGFSLINTVDTLLACNEYINSNFIIYFNVLGLFLTTPHHTTPPHPTHLSHQLPSPFCIRQTVRSTL